MVDLSPYPVIYAFSELIGAPFKNPSMLWIGLPLILSLIIIELNLNSKREEGIKQALPNALILLFVALDMARLVFTRTDGFFAAVFSWPFFACLVVFLLGIKIFYIDYKYSFPQKTFLGISAHFPINLVAYCLLAIVYNQILFGLATICGMILLGALLWVLFFFVRRMEPQKNNSFTPRKSKHHWQDTSRYDMSETLDFSRPKKKANIPSQAPKSSGKIEEGVDLDKSNLVWLKK